MNSDKIPGCSVDSSIVQRGLMLIISSPSGAGKSTISRILREDKTLSLALSVSVTTRKKRPSEVDGIDYHFISIQEFQRLRDYGKLLEWAEVHGNYYATLYETVESMLKNGQDTLFDIDYQGANQIRKKMPEDAVFIFIFPPSMKELKNRLQSRAEDSEQAINLRLENSRLEMQHWQGYDYILVNEDLDKSLNFMRAIVIAERLKRHRRPGLQNFIEHLIKDESS